MRRGHFITFEGGEGAGKTTQLGRLADALAAQGHDVVRTREPGGSASAEALRGLLLDRAHAWQPLSEALLHNAARCEHLEHTVRPALARGAWVLCDRFADSTMAYQSYAQGLDRTAIAALDDLVLAGLRPDLTVVLDVDPDVGLARAGGRGQGADRYEAMDPGFHRRLRDGFRAIAAAAPQRCVLIDADRTADAVYDDVLAAVRQRLGGDKV